MRRMLPLAATVLVVAALAPGALAAPADGSGNKFVVELDDFLPDEVDCGAGEYLDVHEDGWFQGKTFLGKGNRSIELTVFHVIVTFTNDAGDAFVYRDVGPDRFYLDKDGNLILTITGRPANSGEQGFSLNGHMVVNLATGDVAWHGNAGPTDAEQACAALT